MTEKIEEIENWLLALASKVEKQEYALYLWRESKSLPIDDEADFLRICDFAICAGAAISFERAFEDFKPHFTNQRFSRDERKRISRNALTCTSPGLDTAPDGTFCAWVEKKVGYLHAIGEAALACDVSTNFFDKFIPSKEYELCIYGDIEDIKVILDENGRVTEQNFDPEKVTDEEKAIGAFIVRCIQDNVEDVKNHLFDREDREATNQSFSLTRFSEDSLRFDTTFEQKTGKMLDDETKRALDAGLAKIYTEDINKTKEQEDDFLTF